KAGDPATTGRRMGHTASLTWIGRWLLDAPLSRGMTVCDWVIHQRTHRTTRPTLASVMLVSLLAAFWAGAGPAASAEPSPLIHHDLVVALDPANHHVAVRDRIHIPSALVTAPFSISLNADLHVQSASDGLRLVPMTSRVPGSDSGVDRDPASRIPVNVYRVEGAMPGQELSGELNYEGVINYAVQESGGEYARAFSESPGLIEPRGVYLAGSTRWVPRVGDALMT